MNLICWNCRGTAVKCFVGLIRDLKCEYTIAMIALLEPHTSGTLAKKSSREMVWITIVFRKFKDILEASGFFWNCLLELDYR